MICHKLINLVKEKAKNHFIKDIRIGLKYNAVLLDEVLKS